MSKYIQEMQNKYSRGHEQMEKRPYLVVYDSDDYVLGFPLTTKNKKTKPYPSHKNPTVSVDKISDIISEVMIDQLQFIYKNDFTNLSKTLLLDADYQAVIESFVSQIIKSNENPNKDEPSCPNFCNIISFTHNIPQFSSINKWLVVSSKHFNVYAKMCFIVPYNIKELNFAYLHSIDWQARNINIENKIGQTNPKIEKIQHIQESLQRTLKNKFS